MSSKVAKATIKRAVSQKEANDSLRGLIPDAIKFLCALVNDEQAQIRDRLTAAKLIIDKAVPTSSSYEDESIKPQPSAAQQEKKANIYALADTLKAASEKTRKNG